MKKPFSFLPNLVQWLLQPVPSLHHSREKWIFILFTSLFIPVFLILFQPFGVNNYDPTHRIDPQFVLVVSSFGVLNFLVLSFNEFLLASILFKKEKSRGQFLLWIVWTLLLIGSAIFLFYNYLGGFHDWKWSSYFGFLRDVTNMSIIPFGIVILYSHFSFIKKKYTDLAQSPSASTLMNFQSDNGKDVFSIQLNQLLFLESQDNYVAIHYLQEEQIKKVLLRSSLKKMEQDFPNSPLFRCHRSYIVNLNQISQLDATKRQLEILLLDGKRTVPVARRYNAKLKKLLLPY